MPPPKPLPPLKPPPPAPSTPSAPAKSFSLEPAATSAGGQKIALYGTGGIGKTSLAHSAPGPVAFIDLDDSLRVLKLPAQCVPNVTTWLDLRAALVAPIWGEVKTIVIDSMSVVEAMCVAHTIATVKDKKGNPVTSIEGYGFGTGPEYVYDTFAPFLGDLDMHARAGRNVILVCHECVAKVPNPAGDEWPRYEPRLQSPKSGSNSIRLKVKEWADHLLFVGYDVVTVDGKGKGSGTRTIYPAQQAWCMAKSRTLAEPVAYEKGSGPEFWKQLLS